VNVAVLMGDIRLLMRLGVLYWEFGSTTVMCISPIPMIGAGGGIFGFLPASKFGAAYRDHFATPHGLDFAHLAAQSRLDYRRVSNASELASALADQQAGAPSALIEFVASPEANRAAYTALWPRLTAALEARPVSPLSGRRPAAHAAAHNIVTLHGFAGDAEDFGPLFGAATGPLAAAAVEPVSCANGASVPPLADLVSTVGSRLAAGQGDAVLLGYSMGWSAPRSG
jgi:hypothetical protein